MYNNKKLYLSKEDKKLMGVCGGLGEYLDIDATFIRLAFVFAFFVLGTGLLVTGLPAYFVMGLVIPEKPIDYKEPKRDFEEVNEKAEFAEYTSDEDDEEYNPFDF